MKAMFMGNMNKVVAVNVLSERDRLALPYRVIEA